MHPAEPCSFAHVKGIMLGTSMAVRCDHTMIRRMRSDPCCHHACCDFGVASGKSYAVLCSVAGRLTSSRVVRQATRCACRDADYTSKIVKSHGVPQCRSDNGLRTCVHTYNVHARCRAVVLNRKVEKGSDRELCLDGHVETDGYPQPWRANSHGVPCRAAEMTCTRGQILQSCKLS
jgi:hypothetical protein